MGSGAAGGLGRPTRRSVRTKGLIYTIYTRARASREVADCLHNQRGEFGDTAELKLYSAVLDGSPWAVQLLLKTLGKDRGYVERVETETVVSDDEADRLLAEEIEKRADQLARARVRARENGQGGANGRPDEEGEA